MWALAAASSTALAGLGPWASASLRKRCARWRRSGFAGVDVALRASLRACLSACLRAFNAVLRLTFATFAISVVVASGFAASAASARSRASVGAWRLYFRLRDEPRRFER